VAGRSWDLNVLMLLHMLGMVSGIVGRDRPLTVRLED
jgi:hypothetical protein